MYLYKQIKGFTQLIKNTLTDVSVRNKTEYKNISVYKRHNSQSPVTSSILLILKHSFNLVHGLKQGLIIKTALMQKSLFKRKVGTVT